MWWSNPEPLDRRPPREIRNKRLAKRFAPLLEHHPQFTFLVARIKGTGEFAGCAGWHTPGKRWSDNMWLCDVPNGEGWRSGVEWDAEEKQAVWEAVDVEKWTTKWGGYEKIRREEMGEEPHW